MKKLLLVFAVLLVATAVVTGCKSSGSREFVPGTGWVPN